jgi:CheY-like chemotaxis protein
VNQKLLVHMLQRLGYQVAVANNGKGAWHAWKRSDFNIIVRSFTLYYY